MQLPPATCEVPVRRTRADEKARSWRVAALLALAAVLLAFAARFCRTAHEILLDNALTAALAAALLIAWWCERGLSADARAAHIAVASIGCTFIACSAAMVIATARMGAGTLTVVVLADGPPRPPR